MSINTATSRKPCYESHGFRMEWPLAKASADLFVLNLQNLLRREGKTAAALSRHLGVNRSLITAWIQRRSDPGVERLSDIANYFDVSVATFFTDPTDSRSAGVTVTFTAEDALRVLTEVVKKAQKNNQH